MVKNYQVKLEGISRPILIKNAHNKEDAIARALLTVRDDMGYRNPESIREVPQDERFEISWK